MKFANTMTTCIMCHICHNFFYQYTYNHYFLFFFFKEIFLWYIKQVRYQPLYSDFVSVFLSLSVVSLLVTLYRVVPIMFLTVLAAHTHTHTNQTHMIFFQTYLYYAVTCAAHSKKQSIICQVNTLVANILAFPDPTFWESIIIVCVFRVTI